MPKWLLTYAQNDAKKLVTDICQKYKEVFMPGQNRTGPSGLGAKTGRGRGLCGGTSQGVFLDDGRACRGRGRGFGRYGKENMLMERASDLSQREQLAEQKELLRAQLADVTARLEKL
ncbi:MAG: DUF5320 domain-containing protein [Bilophila wadsworthia]